MTPTVLICLINMGEAEIIDAKTYQLLLKWMRPKDVRRHTPTPPMQELSLVNNAKLR